MPHTYKDAELNELLGIDPPNEHTVGDTSFAEAMSRLSVKHAAFVRNILQGAMAKHAYMQVFTECTERSAATNAHALLRHPDVAAALAAGRKEARQQAQYGLQELVDELNSVGDFARDTGNATALARAVELKAKVLGLLVEKTQIDVTQRVDLSGLMLEGHQRVAQIIDVTPTRPAIAAPAPEEDLG